MRRNGLMRSPSVSTQQSARHSWLHRARRVAGWAAALVVPVVIGGLVGGQLGGIVTFVLLVPWFQHRLALLPVPPAQREVPRIRRTDGPLDALVSASRRDRYDSAA
jgi:hypothetical protein